jgi:hypothetical protein
MKWRYLQNCRDFGKIWILGGGDFEPTKGFWAAYNA